MAWRFPDRKLEANSVIDIEDTNSAMLPSVEEATGQLNEQNFARNAFTTVLDYEKDIAYGIMKKLRSPEMGGKGFLSQTRIEIITKSGEKVPTLLSASII